VSIVLKSGSLSLLKPSGPVQACNGIALIAYYSVRCYVSDKTQPQCISILFSDIVDLSQVYLLGVFKFIPQIYIKQKTLWSRQRKHFFTISPIFRPALGPTQPPVRFVQVMFLGVQRPGREVNHSSPSRLRMSGAVRLLGLYAFKVRTGKILLSL
jgi:hypothetical protein